MKKQTANDMPGMTPIQRIKSIIKRKEHIIVDLSKEIKKGILGVIYYQQNPVGDMWKKIQKLNHH